MQLGQLLAAQILEEQNKEALNTKRLPEETEAAYIYRIGSNHDALGGWSQVRDILNAELGYNKSESSYRKPIQCYEQYAKALAGNDEIASIDAKIMELKMERQRLQDVRTEYNKVCRDAARDEEIKDLLKEYFSSSDLVSLDYKPSNVAYTDTSMLVSLNDIHYGASHDNYWGVYNPEVCRKMLCGYLDRIKGIAKVHKPKECVVWMNGDAISGNIHETVKLSNKEHVVSQLKSVSRLIIGFIDELAKNFETVRFCCVAGNHSRITDKDSAPKGERLDDIIEFCCELAFANNPRVKIYDYEKIDDTMYAIDVCGNTIVGIHGDYDGSDGKLALLPTMIGRPVDIVLTAHMHHNSMNTINGVKIIMAGSFQGMDDYCVERRIFGYPEQVVTLVDDKGIVCNYDINLSEFAREEF